MIAPLQAFAAYDKDLEKAITNTKALFSISSAYDNFTYNINKQSERTIFELIWTDSKNRQGTINVSIDTTGKVLNYYAYKPFNPRNQKKLPAISKSDAIKLANNFIQKVNPAIVGKIKHQENDLPVDLNGGGYWLNYIRVENGIPYPENGVNVSVDKTTGEIQNFNLNWHEGLVFPDTKNLLELAQAQKQFSEKLGLKLIYKRTFDQAETKPYLVYTNVYNNRYLDAKTGEIVVAEGYYGYPMEKGMGDEGQRNAADIKPQSLTPQEQDAVKNAANLLDQNKAEEIARKALELDAGYKVTYVNLFKNWQSPEDYIWSTDFATQPQDSSSLTYAVSVSLDAKTGAILSFYRSLPYDVNSKVKYSEEQALTIAEDFIKAMQPEKVKEVERTNWNRQIVRPLAAKELPRESYFDFTRITNGAYFPDNGFRITVDNTSGKVINYNYTWYQKQLPATDKIISSTQAQTILFNSIGIQPQYISQIAAEQTEKILPVPNNNVKRDIKLVYAIKPGKPVNLDAFTGKLLNENGKPYVKMGNSQYNDLRGNFAESKIKVLTEYGIALPGSQLKPNQSATQKEFLYLLEKSIDPYFEYDWSEGSKADDKLYNQLMEAGIVKDGERLPNSIITKQQAIKFIIRALNYDKVAEINKGIYKLPFKDAKQIKADYYGYLALAYGLNIIQGDQGYLQATKGINRAEAFILIYRFLNV